MEKKFKLTDVVQETLLIPLYYRALESRRGEQAILKDNLAEQLVKRIDYDFSKNTNIDSILAYLRELIEECKKEIDDYTNVALLKYTIPALLKANGFNNEDEIFHNIEDVQQDIQKTKITFTTIMKNLRI